MNDAVLGTLKVSSDAKLKMNMGKYEKDLKELEELKLKAESKKGKIDYDYVNPIWFFQVVLTVSLLIIIFAIGFGIAVERSRLKASMENFDFSPKAEIIIPEEVSD